MRNYKINSVEDVKKIREKDEDLNMLLYSIIKEMESLRKEMDEFKKNFKPRLRL